MKIIHNKSLVVLSLLALSLSMQSCVGVRRTVDLSAVTESDEAAYARAVNPFVLQRLGAVVTDESLQGYLATVVTRLRMAEQGRALSVVNDPAPAAYVLPAGEIVVTRGLLYHLESETELLILLAHLLGHDTARHGMELAVLSGDDFDPGNPPAEIAAGIASAHLLKEPFTVAQEMAADKHAAKILVDAGLDPALLQQLLSRLHARLAAVPDFQSGPFTRQHPLAAKRIASDAAAAAPVRTVSASRPAPESGEALSFDGFKSKLLETRPGYYLYQQALQLEKQSASDQAIGLYLKAAAAAPDEALLLTGLGLAYMRQEALVAARQHLTRSARLNSRYYHSQLGLGYIYLQQNSFTKAEKHLRRSQALLPTALGGYFLARLYDDATETQTAIKLYREIVQYYKGGRMAALAEKRIAELESLNELE